MNTKKEYLRLCKCKCGEITCKCINKCECGEPGCKGLKKVVPGTEKEYLSYIENMTKARNLLDSLKKDDNV